MKKISLIVVLLFSIIGINAQKRDDFPSLKGPYLGQKSPGMTPEIFAPGIVSTGYGEIKAVFTPDGKELFYQLWGAPFPVILTMKEKDGRWTKPEVACFSGRAIEGFNISPDGKRIILTSKSPLDGKGKLLEVGRLRFIEKSEKGWGEIKPLKPSIRGYPAIAENGNLYLATGDIWVSKYVDEDYTEMVKLGNSINTEEFYEEDLFIAPDAKLHHVL